MAVEQQSIPTPALALGLGGLIPFISSAVLVWWSQPLAELLPSWIIQQRSTTQLATLALGGYGAVILSFLGGVRWGNLLFDRASLRQWTPLALSVLPSLIAWAALLLEPVPMLALLAAGFTLQYALDVYAERRGELPAWFVKLRLILTSGAIASVLVGMLGNALG